MYEPEDTAQHHTEQRLWLPARENETGTLRGYVRFAALGDSATYGVGDPFGQGWRGLARILAESVGESHDISFCNLSSPGARPLTCARPSWRRRWLTGRTWPP